jgi:hypothetical protein
LLLLAAWCEPASGSGRMIRGSSFPLATTGTTAKALQTSEGVTKEANDLGVVHVTFEGERIVSFRFSHAWPKARFGNGRSHFMGKEFQLPFASEVGSAESPAKIFKTVRVSDGLKPAIPFWHRYFGSIAPELKAILEGTFCVAKKGLPLLPIFPRTTQAGRMMSTTGRYLRELP